MHANQEVTALRKSSKLEEALQVGTAALKTSPDDLWLRQSMAWVYYDYAKRIAAEIEKTLKKSSAPPPSLVASLHGHLRSYARLRLPRPDMALHHLLRVLTSVGNHCDYYVAFLTWVGLDGFSPEDYEPYRTDEGTSPALVTKATRQAVARCLGQPEELKKWSSFLLDLLDRAIRNEKEADSNRIWLFYDRAALYQRLGRITDAAAEMRRVLKLKRDYWAWAKMAEIEAERNPGLAVACYAQAMLCRPEAKFTGRLRLNFGRLLQQRGETAAAVSEYLAAAEVYRSEGWRFPDELESVLQANWFNPEVADVDQKRFYQSRAGEALDVLYDHVRQVNASFIDERQNPAGKTRYLISTATSRGPEQMLTRWPGRKSTGLQPGKALTLTVGEDEKGTHVLAIAPRPDGRPWDCLQTGEGIIAHMKEDGTRGGVFLARDSHAILVGQPKTDDRPLRAGDAVQVWISRNPKKDQRLEAFYVKRLHSLPQSPDIAIREGELRIHEKGFAFVDDVFVPPHVVDPDLDHRRVAALCVFDFNKSKGTYGWKALLISAIDNSVSEVTPSHGFDLREGAAEDLIGCPLT